MSRPGAAMRRRTFLAGASTLALVPVGTIAAPDPFAHLTGLCLEDICPITLQPMPLPRIASRWPSITRARGAQLVPAGGEGGGSLQHFAERPLTHEGGSDHG